MSKIPAISKPLEQEFSLPPSLINFVIKHGSHSNLRKLNSSCKYFPKEHSILLLTQFAVESTEEPIFEYKQKSLRLSIDHPATAKLNNVFVGTTFSFQDQCRSSLSKIIIPKLLRCDARFIDIWNQNMSAQDFDALVSSNRVQQLYLEDVNIQSKNEDEKFPLEDVIRRCCNATSITINSFKASNISCTKNTSAFFSKFKLNSKLRTFTISNLNQFFDASDFCDFLKNNAAPKASITLFLDHGLSHQYLEKLRDTITRTQNFWLPRRESPSVAINIKRV